MPILRDHSGRPWLPGSSIRGALRDACEREAALLGVKREAVIRLFGPPPGVGGIGPDRQGRLTVTDAGTQEATSEIRDHVKIDAHLGAAERRKKFNAEVVDVRTATLRLVYEGDAETDEEVTLLQFLASALSAGVIPFGARSGSGIGLCQATRVEWRQRARGTAAGLAGFVSARLTGNQRTDSVAGFPAVTRQPQLKLPDDPEAWSWLRLPLALQFDGPMLTVGRTRRGQFVDNSVEFESDDVYATDVSGRPIYPGSSLRGVLRSHASRIARSLSPGDADRIIQAMFGAVGTRDRSGHRGLLCVSEGTSPDESEQPALRMDHVAIDRVTNFAARHLLFNTAALQSPRFETELLVRWNRENHAHQQGLALLLLVLRDAAASLLWAGSRTTRGYGHLVGVGFGTASVSLVNRDKEGLLHRADTIPIQSADPIKLWETLGVAVAWDAFRLEAVS